MLLEITRLYQQFGENEILKDISLEIKQGETFVIIGPTGSGKTTLLRLIGLLDKPVSGTISFRGQEIPNSARARLALRRRMAMVSQKPAGSTSMSTICLRLRKCLCRPLRLSGSKCIRLEPS